MSNIKFRKAKITDLDAIVKIENESFSSPWKREDLAHEISGNPVNEFLVATIDENIVGYVDYFITFSSSTIAILAVDKSYRNQGIATALLNELETHLPKDAENGVDTITLEVRKSNIPAINLYKKFGYKDVVTKPHYYSDGEDAIYMVKWVLKWQ